MFLCNNEYPKKVFVNGNELIFIQYDNKVHWSKPFSLFFENGENFEIVVTRISSNFGAELKKLSTEDPIFYGDHLNVTVELNGTAVLLDLKSGVNSIENGQNLLVTTHISLSASVSAGAEQWRLVFSGEKSTGLCSSTNGTTCILGFTGLIEKKTRISGQLINQTGVILHTLTDIEMQPYDTYEFVWKNKTQEIFLRGTQFEVTIVRPVPTFFYKPMEFVFTKVEQYY